jgi:hypothetical protein
MRIKIQNNKKLASLLLRVGLASVLLYVAISSFLTPSDWVGYLPHFLTSRFSGHTLLFLFSVYELLLAVWLLSKIYIKYAAALAALTFSIIIFTNPGLLPITFRDITMVFAALALIAID